MQAVMHARGGKKFAGVRLVQAAYHNRSLSLYAKLGFVVREPLACMQGQPIRRLSPAIASAPPWPRPRTCNELCLRVHGHDRAGELNEAIQQGTAVVAESDGCIKSLRLLNRIFRPRSRRDESDLQALLAEATEFQGPGILVPTRNAGLFRWCLENGLRVVQPMTLMTSGLYNEPVGAYLPSILF